MLLLRGPQIALGYMGHVDATRAKFLYDRQSDDGSARLYDSGDCARLLQPTGDIEFMGRVDDQVKIGGQRVELGAVESAVQSCTGVASCAVLVVEQGGSKALAAFVVKADSDNNRDDAAFARAVQQWVAQRVARHEVPHRVICVERIPLTSAGKVNRVDLLRRLRLSCDLSVRELTVGHFPEIHSRVRRIFAKALGLQISDDLVFSDWNFFPVQLTVKL